MSFERDGHRKHGMTMRTPATRWQDASPTGNGTVGAMMYGQIRSDRILLNHDALYYPCEPDKQVDVSDQMPEVRRLIDQGRYQEAQALIPAVHAERGGVPEGSTSESMGPYQPFCDIELRASTQGPFRHYRRGIDFETGRIWMTWEDDAGGYIRELFVSRADDTLVLRIRGSEGASVSYRMMLGPHDVDRRETGGWSSNTGLEPADYESHADEEGWMTFTGRYGNACVFGAVGRVTVVNGRLGVDQDWITVEGADEVLVQVRLFIDADPGEAAPELRRELAHQSTDFEQALAAHADLHGGLFRRMTLELSDDEPASNEEMLMAAYEDTAPTPLVQAMFEFGRYLMICANRLGGWPANLQGVWNGDYAPAWNSDFHNDENIQMNYWAALPGNLPELTLPFFDYYESHMDDYRDNARNLHGCGGIFVPIAQTTHGLDFPRVWTNWISAAGWLAQLFYDYYLFTGDRSFLAERAVPWLKETALFYEDYLFEGSDGKYVFSPSLSPENVPPGEDMSLVTINATMDVAVCREVLSNLCDACKSLDIDHDGVARWRAMLTKLPEYEINEDGALREWLHPAFRDNYHHRHQSHLYPLFPGFEITRETHPDLYEACRIAVEKRLVIGLTSQTGWSMAHMANVYARLEQGDLALECIEILTRSSTGPNLFTYHNDWRDMGLSLTGWGAVPPFQIDANYGMTAAILEMLVFSKPGFIKLLPAIADRWRRGRVSGIACRGGILLDMSWDRTEGCLNARLVSRTDQEVLIKLPQGTGSIDVKPEQTACRPSDLGTSYRHITLPRETPVCIEAEMA